MNNKNKIFWAILVLYKTVLYFIGHSVQSGRYNLDLAFFVDISFLIFFVIYFLLSNFNNKRLFFLNYFSAYISAALLLIAYAYIKFPFQYDDSQFKILLNLHLLYGIGLLILSIPVFFLNKKFRKRKDIS
jgi:hypothetical protein